MDGWALSIGINFDEEDIWNVKYLNGDGMASAFIHTMLRGMQRGIPFYDGNDTDSDAYRDYETDLEYTDSLIIESVSGVWVFFRSPKGYIGLAHPGAKHTDKICILLGASVPFILRWCADHYVLVSEAYVHGLMYGEAINMAMRGELEVEAVNIY
jgi:hypothetical protein